MKAIFRTKTYFGEYKVVDQTYNDRPARVLYAGKATPQSGLALDDEPELLFDYIQRCMEVALSINPKKVLVIGGGAFTLPKALIERTHVERVDAVEIDPDLFQIAKKYFDLPITPRLRVIIADGENYIKTVTEKYDLIIIDAFQEYDIPAGLLELAAVERYEHLLSSDGVVTLNFIGYYHGRKSGFVREIEAAFHSVFGAVEVYLADPDDDPNDEQNLLLVASKTEVPALDYLQTRQLG